MVRPREQRPRNGRRLDDPPAATEDFCRRCGSYLGWSEEDDEGSQLGPRTPGPQQTGPLEREVRHGAVARLSETEETTEPGGEVVLTLKVRNTGTVVDRFQLQVQGQAAAWTEVEPVSVSLMPDCSWARSSSPRLSSRPAAPRVTGPASVPGSACYPAWTGCWPEAALLSPSTRPRQPWSVGQPSAPRPARRRADRGGRRGRRLLRM